MERRARNELHNHITRRQSALYPRNAGMTASATHWN